MLPTRWRQKSTGIDVEQNYVTVTLCINPKQIGTEMSVLLDNRSHKQFDRFGDRNFSAAASSVCETQLYFRTNNEEYGLKELTSARSV